MTRDKNDTIIDTYDDKYEVETDKNHIYVDIPEFGLKKIQFHLLIMRGRNF